MKGYVFLSNSPKPTVQEQLSRTDVKLTNVSRPCLKAAIDMGYTVYFGINRSNPNELKCELPVKMFDSHTYRDLLNIKDNIIAYKNLSEVVKNNNIKVIHCNTPIGGLIGRLVGTRYNVDKIIYTVHGFHFFQGQSFFKNLIFKFSEKVLARFTDVIITINEEDYQAAKKFKLKKNGKIFKVHGVGIDTISIKNIDVSKNEIRKKLGLKFDDTVLISAGRLEKNKNYKAAIDALSLVKDKDNIKYLICGVGPSEVELKKYAKEKGVESKIFFLGYRDDVIEIMKASDIFLLTSLREGLPRSVMEAMACGLPCIVSDIRGNRDLIDDNLGGFIIDVNDKHQLNDRIMRLVDSLDMRLNMREYNLKKIKKYDSLIVEKELRYIYNSTL